MFTVNIPALTPPACPLARQCLLWRSALAIAANTSITEAAHAAATTEYHERMHCYGTTGISVGEVAAAEERLYAVKIDAVVARYYGSNHPMGAGLYAPLQDGIRNLTALTQEAVRDMERVNQRLDALERHELHAAERLSSMDDTLEAIENC